MKRKEFLYDCLGLMFIDAGAIAYGCLIDKNILVGFLLLLLGNIVGTTYLKRRSNN